MPKVKVRPPVRAPREQSVELYALRVHPDVLARLKSLVADTGASMAWHRRRALEDYLDDLGY